MLLKHSDLQQAIIALDESVQYSKQVPNSIDPVIIRDSVIHRFKYTYELSWKLLQR